MPTIRDVATHAGVSRATVSRVIQGSKNVNPVTRAKVQKVIDELGYVPSAVARGLRSKRTRSLALVVSDVTNVFFTTVARGVEDVAQEQDYSVLLCNTDEDQAKQDRYIDFLISQQVDGVIIAPYAWDARHLDKLRRRRIPTVIIDRRIDGWDVDSVTSDSVSGDRALVKHLIDLGHTSIALISGPTSTSTAEDRVAGYCLAFAQAGLEVDTRLIRQGEYRTTSGEELAGELLDEGLRPTAIFAANNVIAVGVVDALEKRNLRIPQDIALVCYDDLPNASHLFPFLTVVTQPAYDMGANAAQLLLSRLDSEVELQPRHVVLPSRLIVRYSCGSTLSNGGRCPLSLPFPKDPSMRSELVKPLRPEESRDLHSCVPQELSPIASRRRRLPDAVKPDLRRLLKTLQHEQPDRVPHIELNVNNQRVYEYVLERDLGYDLGTSRGETPAITPEDQVEFALRLGMDAVACHFDWQSNGLAPAELESPPSLASQLSSFERYLRTVQGTGVGIIASFRSFMDVALFVENDPDAADSLMETVLGWQARVMRMVCDRFAEDLALVLVRDDIAGMPGLSAASPQHWERYSERMRRLIAPAREHGKLVALQSNGRLDGMLTQVQDIGFSAVHPTAHDFNDLLAMRERWHGKIALIGNIPTELLALASPAEIEEATRQACTQLGPGGGYVLSTSAGISPDVPPENFVAMIQAVHRHGRLKSSG